MDYVDFSRCLLMHPGIIRMELLTDEILKEVHSIEYSEKNVGFLPNDPIGLFDIEDHDLRLILFCSHEFPMFTESFIKIVDGKGEVVGYDVLDEDKDKMDSPDYVWLTKNIFFDISKLTDYGMKCVIDSLSMNVEGLPEDIRPRVFYPCVDTANHLNRKFGAEGKICATVLLGVDGVTFRYDFHLPG